MAKLYGFAIVVSDQDGENRKLRQDTAKFDSELVAHLQASRDISPTPS